MKLMNRFYSLLVLLLVGSASLQAQGGDPFGDFNPRDYKNNMTINAQVQQNGAVVTNALIAVYCENELRGKANVGNGTDPQLAYLSVYGNSTGSDQYLYFKVYTGGVTFTCNPDPAIVFSSNGSIGTFAPYIIDITPVNLANDADNTATLTTYKDETCDVVLTGRTLYKDGDWNTICLPFTLTASEVNEHLGNPTGLMTLSSSSFDSTTGTLTLNFSDELENGIVAGKPYIVKWTTGDDLVNPVFTGVTISDATNNVSTDYADFIGTYTYMGFTAEDRSILFLGAKNTLYYPQSGAHLGACRAYFRLKGLVAGDIKEARMYFEEDSSEATIISPAEIKEIAERADAAWYTLDGRKLNAKPTKKGLYIYKGKKVKK